MGDEVYDHKNCGQFLAATYGRKSLSVAAATPSPLRCCYHKASFGQNKLFRLQFTLSVTPSSLQFAAVRLLSAAICYFGRNSLSAVSYGYGRN